MHQKSQHQEVNNQAIAKVPVTACTSIPHPLIYCIPRKTKEMKKKTKKKKN